MNNFVKQYLEESIKVIEKIDILEIEKIANILSNVRNNGGKLFIFGLGGSSANASHACNDFKKICNIETYAPTDNISFLTAVANDEGLENIFSSYLRSSSLNENDAIMILSVGGGDISKNISISLIEAIKYSKSVNAKILGIVGRDGGFTAQNSDACLIIPPLFNNHITPITESLTSVVLHCLCSCDQLKLIQTKWESTK